MSPQTFIFIGRSGCGKGTQVELLTKHLKNNLKSSLPVFYLETGHGFRDFIKGDTFSSALAKEVYENGDRQPDFLAVWMWAHLFIENLTGEEHIIIDGTPRSLPEAQSLDTALRFYKRKARVIYLNVSRELSEERLRARGRFDDKDFSKITRRLDWFEKDVMPAIEYYRNSPDYDFVEVMGEREKKEVHEDIVKNLKLS